MNLTKLFEAQQVLDQRIEQEHTVKPEEDRLGSKCLALNVELGEAANEWRGFKFWSKNRNPVTKSIRPIFGTNVDGTQHQSFVECNPLLEELVDCLHFILSIGNDIGASIDYMSSLLNGLGDWKFMNGPTEGFNRTLFYTTNFEMNRDIESYYDAFITFMSLIVWLNIKLEEIETAYYEKNKINHQRQEDGY